MRILAYLTPSSPSFLLGSVISSDGLGQQQFAMGQQHSQFLAAQRLHMHRTINSRPHHLRHPARIVAVHLVDLGDTLWPIDVNAVLGLLRIDVFPFSRNLQLWNMGLGALVLLLDRRLRRDLAWPALCLATMISVTGLVSLLVSQPGSLYRLFVFSLPLIVIVNLFATTSISERALIYLMNKSMFRPLIDFATLLRRDISSAIIALTFIFLHSSSDYLRS